MEKFEHELNDNNENKVAEKFLDGLLKERQTIENRMKGITINIMHIKEQIESGSKSADPEWLSEKLAKIEELKKLALEYGFKNEDLGEKIGRDESTQIALDEYSQITEEIEMLQHEIDEQSPTITPEDETKMEEKIDLLQAEYNTLLDKLNKLEDGAEKSAELN